MCVCVCVCACVCVCVCMCVNVCVYIGFISNNRGQFLLPTVKRVFKFEHHSTVSFSMLNDVVNLKEAQQQKSDCQTNGDF